MFMYLYPDTQLWVVVFTPCGGNPGWLTMESKLKSSGSPSMSVSWSMDSMSHSKRSTGMPSKSLGSFSMCWMGGRPGPGPYPLPLMLQKGIPPPPAPPPPAMWPEAPYCICIADLTDPIRPPWLMLLIGCIGRPFRATAAGGAWPCMLWEWDKTWPWDAPPPISSARPPP